ncbi:hypothetical protein D3C83_228090 [compost metagenome]
MQVSNRVALARVRLVGSAIQTPKHDVRVPEKVSAQLHSAFLLRAGFSPRILLILP